MPCPATVDHLGVNIDAANHDDAKSSTVAVFTGLFDNNSFAKDNFGQSLFRLGSITLFGFRGIDSFEPYLERFFVDQDGDGVTIGDADTLPVSSSRTRGGEAKVSPAKIRAMKVA